MCRSQVALWYEGGAAAVAEAEAAAAAAEREQASVTDWADATDAAWAV